MGDPDAADPVWERYSSMAPGLGPEAVSRLLRYQIEGGSTEDDPEEGDEAEDDDVTSCTSEYEPGNIGDLTDEERSR